MKLIKMKNGNWLYPDEVEKIDQKNVIKKSDKTKVVVGPQSQCQNQKKIQLIQKQ